MPDTKAALTAIAIRDAHASLDGWGGLRVTVWSADLRLLLDKIADLCPSHGWCQRCEAEVCIPCGLGDFAACDCPALHCRSEACQARCIVDNHLDDDRASLSLHDMLGGVR